MTQEVKTKVLWDWLIDKVDYIKDYDEYDGKEVKELENM